MAMTFDPIFAADPSNAANVAANASITIFDPADVGMAPITITDVTGSPLTNPVTVNKNGFGPAFVADIDRVGWSGGGFTGYFTSYEGMKAVAVDAAAAAQDVVSRADAGEFAGAMGPQGAPGADGSNVLPTDIAIKDAMTTPGTETATALSVAILDGIETVAADPAGVLQPRDQGDRLVSKLRIREGDMTVAVAGDSTGNLIESAATDEWVGLWLRRLAAANPDTAISVQTPGQVDPYPYGSTVVIQAGGTAMGTAGTDSFARSGDLIGSTAPDGQLWSALVADAAGDWTTDGAAAVRSADALSGANVLNVGSGDSASFSLSWTMLHASGAASTKDRRVLLACKDATNYLYLRVATATNGGLVWSLNQTIAGTNTVLVTGATNVLTASGTPQTPILSASYDFGTGAFSGTLAAATINATVDATPRAALVGATMVGIFASTSSAGETIQDVTWDVAGITPAHQSLHTYNGSISGSRLETQLPIISTLYPEPVDLLFISSSHNYTTRPIEEYEAALDEFLVAFKAHDPDAGIVIMSQNPQNYNVALPTRRDDQFGRSLFLKSYARKRGIGYIGVTEAYVAEGDWSDLVANGPTDFIHPTGGEEVGAVKTGSSVWADAVEAYLAAL